MSAVTWAQPGPLRRFIIRRCISDAAGICALGAKRMRDRRYLISAINSNKPNHALKNPKVAHIISTRWWRVLTTPLAF